jgi:MFS transporter, DHA1 family, multidrug resistance protein
MSTSAARPVTRASISAAGVTLFLSFMDVAALLPTVAPHVRGLGAGATGVGLAVGAYSATNLPANILGGLLLDRVGRRRVTILGFLLAALAVLGYSLATTVGGFIAIRATHGIAGGILVTAVFAVAGDRTRAGGAGRSFGRFGALIGAAWVIGPAMAGAVRQLAGTDVVFRSIAVLLLVGALVTALFIHDVPRDESDDPSAGDDAVGEAVSRGRAMRELAGRPPVRRALVATIAWMGAVGILAGFLPETAEALGAPASAVGGLFTAYAVMAGLMMLSPLAGRVDRGGADGMIAAGLAIVALALAAMIVAPDLTSLVLASALFGTGYGLIFPAVTGVVSLAATTRTRGRAFGLFNAAFSVGLALGAPIAGGLADVVVRASGGLDALDPFIPAAGLCLAAACWVLAASRRERRATAHVDRASA